MQGTNVKKITGPHCLKVDRVTQSI